MPKPTTKTPPAAITVAPAGGGRTTTSAGMTWKLFMGLIGITLLAIAARTAPTWITKLGMSGDALKIGRNWADRAANFSTPILILTAALTVLAGIAAAISGRHRAQNERLATALAREVRSTAPTRELVRVGRGLTGRPNVLRVRLPADFPAEDTKARKPVEQSVARVLGGYWTGDWQSNRLRKGRLKLKRSRGPAITDSDIESNSDKARMLVVARRIFGQTGRLHLTVGLDTEGRAQSFTLVHPPHPGLATPQFRDRVIASLTQLLPGLWEVDCDLQADTMTGQRRPMLLREIPYILQPITAGNRFQIQCAAVAGQLAPATWNLDGKTPHAMVTGETGGGKTYAFLNLAVELLRRGIPIFGIDPKKIELMSMEGWPGLEQLATDPEAAVQVIEYLHDLMMWRYTLIQDRKIRRSDLWPVVVFLDELLILQDELNDHWAMVKARDGIKGGKDHPAIRKIIRMAALARSARIHLCVGVQRPQATLFPEGARDNFRFRLSLGALTQEGAIQMWGDAHTGTDVPTDIPGRGTISTPTGPREAQVFKLPELDLYVQDEDLPPADAALRAQLLAECAAAISNRPKDIYLEIGGYVSSAAADADAVTLTKPTPASPAALKPATTKSTTPAQATVQAAAPVALTVDDIEIDADDDQPVMMSVRGLSIGDKIRIEDPNTSGSMVDAAVEEVDDTAEDGRVLIDYRTFDGRPGQLDLDDSDEIQLAN